MYVLHGGALDVHFANFYVISASYEAQVGLSYELALCLSVNLVTIIDADRKFAGLEG